MKIVPDCFILLKCNSLLGFLIQKFFVTFFCAQINDEINFDGQGAMLVVPLYGYGGGKYTDPQSSFKNWIFD